MTPRSRSPTSERPWTRPRRWARAATRWPTRPPCCWRSATPRTPRDWPTRPPPPGGRPRRRPVTSRRCRRWPTRRKLTPTPRCWRPGDAVTRRSPTGSRPASAATSRSSARTPAVIDYFATSLPSLLLFDDDPQRRRDLLVGVLRAQLALLDDDLDRADTEVAGVLAADPSHELALDLRHHLEPSQEPVVTDPTATTTAGTSHDTGHCPRRPGRTWSPSPTRPVARCSSTGGRSRSATGRRPTVTASRRRPTGCRRS